MQLIEQPQHIPSSQTVPEYYLGRKPIMITAFQFDAMNFICFEAQKQISMKYGLTKNKQIAKDDELKLLEIQKYHTIETEKDLFDFLRNQEIKINLNDLSVFTNKYKSNNIGNMYKELEKLQDIKVKVEQFKTDSVSNELKSKTSRFPLITRIDSYKNGEVVLRLEHELIFGWVFEAIPFSRVLIKEQATLSTLYTKHIYALCSEYQGMAEKNNGVAWFEVEFEKFKNLLGLKAPNVSKLKGNYLNKAVKEINEKTIFNIILCKGKKEKGVNYIRFEYEVGEMPDNLSIEEQLLYNKKEAMALERLEKTKEFEEIRNEEAWLKKTISSISDSEVEMVDNINSAKSVLDSIDIKEYNKDLYDKFGDWVRMENYKLVYIYVDESVLTKNAIETLEVIKGFEDE